MSLDSGSEASTTGDTSTRQFPETETGPMAESDLPAVFTARDTPRKTVITYQKKKKQRQQDSKSRQTVLAANDTSEPDDESEDEQATRDEGPTAPTRSAERLQPSKTTRRQPKPSARTVTRKPVSKGAPSAGSDGSDLTDIGENNVGKEAGEAASSQPKTRRGRPAKTTTYAESDSGSSVDPAPVKGQSKQATAAGKKAGKSPSENLVDQDTRDEDAELSASSLSSLGGSPGDAETDKDSEKTKGRSSRGNQAQLKRKEIASSEGKSDVKVPLAKKGKHVDEQDNLPRKKQAAEPSKSKRSKTTQEPKADYKAAAGQTKKKAAAADSAVKKAGNSKRAIASTSSTTPASGSPKKPTSRGRKGKTQLKPQSSTQLSDPFLAMVFGSSQPLPKKTRMLSDTDSSDEDERQKVSKLFDATRHTPQKRKGKDGEDEEGRRGKKQKKGSKSKRRGGDEDSTTEVTESEAEPEEIEFRRDLSALDGTYVYCRNGRLGLYFGGVVVGYDDLKELSPAKKKKHKDGIYLIKLPVEDDKVFRKRRDEFFTEDDEDFATCKLGETAPEIDVNEQLSDARERLSTPPLPPDIETAEFDSLDYAIQLRAIRPHLESVIREEYPPAQSRIDRFWFRGKARTFTQWHGNVSAHNIEGIFVPELIRWALRPPIKRTGDDTNGDATSVPPPRPTGSERYELLSDDEREFYVRKILVNEAIIYICLKTMNLENLDLDALNARWADQDLFPEEEDVDRKTSLMRDLLARKELDQLAHNDPDAYSIWASLMETRNLKRTTRGLPLEGKKQAEKPIEERGGRAARARNNVSYRE